MLTSGNRDEGAHSMLELLQIAQPTHLIEAAEHWGVVEVRDEPNPDWRGG